jgi:hypothetical protein
VIHDDATMKPYETQASGVSCQRQLSVASNYHRLALPMTTVHIPKRWARLSQRLVYLTLRVAQYASVALKNENEHLTVADGCNSSDEKSKIGANYTCMLNSKVESHAAAVAMKRCM